MKDLLSKFETGEFEFKEPWRAGKALAVIVPIVAKKTGVRKYVVLEEVKDKVRITDTGSIGEAKVEGDVDKPTFIRGGTMLKGATQERATQFSVIIAPQKSEQLVPVHCVHASKSIRPGAFFTLASAYTPPTVHSNIMATRNQTYTWNAVARYSANLLARLEPSTRPPVSHDNLVAVQESVTKFRKDLEEMLKQIPDYMDQVGSVVIDPDGVVGLEMFDHPESWKAVTEKVKRTFTEALTREDKVGIFKPDLDAALTVINDFLEKLEKREEEKEVFNKNNAKTVIFKIEGYVGEYTTLNSETIHLTITRREEKPPTRISQRTPFSSSWRPSLYSVSEDTTSVTPQSTTYYTITPPAPLWGRKGLQVLRKLEKPKTWTNLTSELKMSKATLSSHLKKFQKTGLVEKYRSPNGKTRYSLTAMGQEWKKRLSKQL